MITTGFRRSTSSGLYHFLFSRRLLHAICYSPSAVILIMQYIAIWRPRISGALRLSAHLAMATPTPDPFLPSFEILVELVGLEPATPCMPCRCSSQLSYNPIKQLEQAYCFNHINYRLALCTAQPRFEHGSSCPVGRRHKLASTTTL